MRMKETVSRLEKLLAEEEWESARDVTTELKYLEGIESAAKDRVEKVI